MGGCLREREGEVEALAEALEGQKGVRGKVARGHLTVGLLVAARWTLALKPADQQVDTGAAVLADSRSTATRAGRQLAALSWTQRDGHGKGKKCGLILFVASSISSLIPMASTSGTPHC